MRGFNRAIIAGNLTRDPEARYTVNKKAYARFTVAVNNRYKDANGEYKENADYITVVAWGNQAETAGKYLKKGSPVLIEGRIKTGSYDAKDGTGKRYTTEIWADNLIMLGSRENSPGTDDGWPQSTDKSPYEGDIQGGNVFGDNIEDSGFGSSSNNVLDSSDSSNIPF